MENSSLSLNVYCRKRCSCSIIEQSSKLKCNGSTLGLMKLHGRWQIKCWICILPCLPIEAKQLWYGGLVIAYGGLVFSYVGLVFAYDGLVFSLWWFDI